MTIVALDMLEPLFFFLLLELLYVMALIMKMTHFMASVAHEMREILSCFLLHLLFSFSFTLCHLLVEAKATLVTILSLICQYMLEGGFGVVASLYLLLNFFTSLLSSLFSFKRLVSQDIKVEQAFICEEHGISNKSSQEVDTCFLPTSQGLATTCD
jgi:hypothetical protein